MSGPEKSAEDRDDQEVQYDVENRRRQYSLLELTKEDAMKIVKKL